MAEPQYRLEGIVRTKSEEMEDFEGPLDVIFLLLSKNRIEIQNVSITAILEQYLAYLDERKELDMEIASEFITMASHLMLIKTKMLLSAAEQAEAETELDQLRKSLEDRRRKEALEEIRRGAAVLEQGYEIGCCHFPKEPEPLRRELRYRYRHSPEDLLRALEQMAQRNEKALPPPKTPFQGIVGREPYPVGRKAAQLLRRLVERGVMRMKALFQGNRSRSEVVATFLAVLELCKHNRVRLDPEDGLEDPRVELIPTAESNPSEQEESTWNWKN